MTEKRFTKVENIFDIGDEGVKDNQTKIEYYYALDMIDVLNAQHEEIERLRKENKELEKFRYAVFKNLHKITEKELEE